MINRRLMSPEQERIVYEHFHKKSIGGYRCVKEFILEKFQIDLTLKQVKNFLRNKGIVLGVSGQFKKGHIPANKGKKMPKEVYEKLSKSMFKKGNTPRNHKPLGTKRKARNGYIEMKVSEPNIWRPFHRVVWEEHTGEKLQNNEIIIFIDGNKENCNFENLTKVTRSQLIRINQNHLLCDNPEISKVGITLGKLIDLKHKRSNR